jgi:hypothetical protein
VVKTVKGADAGSAMLLLLVLSLFAGPAEYLAHEGAHYLVAYAIGAHPTMHFDHVEFHAHLEAMPNLLVTVAGPAVDWVVGIGALVALARRYTPLALVLAIFVARPFQFLHGALGIDLSPIGISGNLVGTDEGVIAEALGMSPRDIILAELTVATPLLLLIVYYMPSKRRIAIAVLSSGVLAGWAGWLALGPYLLP